MSLLVARAPDRSPSDVAGPHAALCPLPPEQALARLESGAGGLSAEEAAQRRLAGGPNEMPQAIERPLLPLLVGQLTHLMAVLLWVAGLLAFASHTPELGWAIWCVVLINAAFSFTQEYRAERALAELARMMPAQVRVRRGGVVVEAAASDLVPGDVVELEAGDRISADARIIEAERLAVDLSVLTGESVPVTRHAEAAQMEGVREAEVPNLALAGAIVVSGRGAAVVYATGPHTVIGRVAHLTAGVRREASTLEVQIDRVVRLVSVLSVLVGAAVFALAWGLVGMAWREAFVFSIGIIVANVPEGLLPTVTLALALAVQRMAKRRALVRRLSAVETLSAVDVICTDKTGTLTENEMTVRSLWVPTEPVEVTGSGYDPRGEIRAQHHGRQVRLLLAAAALCSNARLVRQAHPDAWHCIGDPTEGALVVAAVKARLRPQELAHEAPRLREIAFDSQRKRMTVVRRWGLPSIWHTAATHLAFTKGAPAEVLARCNGALGVTGRRPWQPQEREVVQAAVDAYAAQGCRVLAVAFREGGSELLSLEADALESELTFVGLTAMLDPPRPGVAEALASCREAGVRVTMLTGDYGLTAEAIARRIGLVGSGARVVSGGELDRMADEALDEVLAGDGEVIFARATPEHKLRVVQAYQRCGRVVAVTGDGVNDAPALRAAHIGIAMGVCGTDVAREAADIVLLDDDFTTIVSAIEAGRSVYANLRKFMTYILASNVPELLPFVAMVAFKIPPALTILQILAVDLGTDMVPALALGAEAPDPDEMKRPPRPLSQPLLDLPLLGRAYGFLGLIEALASMTAFMMVWGLAGYGLQALQAVAPQLAGHAADPALTALYRASTTAALVAIIASQAGNLFACRAERRRLTPLARNPLLWVGLAVEAAVVAAMLTVPALARVFQTAPLPASVWAVTPLWPLLLVVLDGVWKRVRG